MRDSTDSRRVLWPAIALPVLFLCFAVPLIRSGNMSGTGAYDQLLFHEPAIRQFVREWPRFDFSNYLSATTPGYHLLLAAYARFIDPARTALQLFSAVFSVGLFALLAAAASRRSLRARQETPAAPADPGVWLNPQLVAMACSLPMAASMYVNFRGVWLAPDNLGWWLVLMVLVVSLRAWNRWSPVLAGVSLLGLVFVRQSHLWAAAPLWAAAWLSIPGERTPSTFAASVRSLFDHARPRLVRLAVALVATLPAFLIVLAFVRLWNGLVVPRFQHVYHGRSPAAPAFILSNLAIASGFCGALILPYFLDLWRRRKALLLAAAVLALLLAAAPPTSYSFEHGRYSGLWTVVKHAPVIAGRTSPVLLVLAPLGAVALVCWMAALPHRERWIFGAALAGFTAAQTASPQLWQRYNEPFLLMLIALWAGPALAGAGRPPRLLRPAIIAGPVALSLLFALVTYRTIATSEPVVPEESEQYVAPADP